jgi:hypothetical protein
MVANDYLNAAYLATGIFSRLVFFIAGGEVSMLRVGQAEMGVGFW